MFPPDAWHPAPLALSIFRLSDLRLLVNEDNGRLETDRPHVFNAYGAYIFNWLGAKLILPSSPLSKPSLQAPRKRQGSSLFPLSRRQSF